MTRIPLVLAAIPLLAVARLLPAEGLGLAFRLTAASLCLLIPGALIARALRLPAVAEAVALSLGVLFLGMLVTFALGTSILVTLIVLGAAASIALPFALRREPIPVHRVAWAVAGVGAVFAVFIWRFGPALGGDALFHLARVRKLETFDELSIDAVGEFADGGPHPGYAFPLWHGFLALVSKLAGVDPTDVVLNEAAILVPIAFVVVFEAGRALFNSVWGGVAVLAGQVAITGLAPGDGGAYDSLALPATAARQLLVPIVLASLFLLIRERRWLFAIPVAAASLAIALSHPTYALFLLVPLTGLRGRAGDLDEAGRRAFGERAGGGRGSDRGRPPLAPPDRRGHGGAHAAGGGGSAGARAVRARARRRVARPLLACAGGLRPQRRGRGRCARRDPARGLCGAQPVGGVRRRRLAADPPPDARGLLVPLVRGSGVALAGAADRRVPAVRVRLRGRLRRARRVPPRCRAAGGAWQRGCGSI